MTKNANNTHCYQNVGGAVFRVQGPYPNIENIVTLWNVIISSDQHSFMLRHWSKAMTIFKKCPIFSVFCVFLNKE